jgi:hypothetical protein
VHYGFAPQKHLFCHVDCKHLADLSEDGCFDWVKSVVDEAISIWEASPVPASQGAACPDAYYWLERTVSLFDRAGIQLIVQLDDFDWLACNDHLSLRLFDNLRALGEASGIITYLTASRVTLVDLQGEIPHIAGSPFFDIFWQCELQPFDPGETRRFMETRLGSVEGAFPEGILEFVCGLSRGEPYRLQVAGACAYDVWCEKGRCPLCDGDCGEIEERFNRELESASSDPV